MDAWLLAKQAQISGLNAEVAGMMAKNNIRIQRNETPVYSDSHFQERAQELHGIYNEIRSQI